MIKERNEFSGIVLEEWNKRVSGSSMEKKWKLCCTRAVTGTFQRKRCFLLANHRIVSFDVSRKNEIEFLATLRYSERREYRKDTSLYIFTDFYTLLQDIRRKDSDDTLKRGEKDK